MLTAIVDDIRAVLNHRKDLLESFPFKITVKASKDSDKRDKLSHYEGPDDETVAMLEQNGDSWSKQPQIFWNGPRAAQLSKLSGPALLVGCFVQLERSDT